MNDMVKVDTATLVHATHGAFWATNGYLVRDDLRANWDRLSPFERGTVLAVIEASLIKVTRGDYMLPDADIDPWRDLHADLSAREARS